jgi:hypothetical protein
VEVLWWQGCVARWLAGQEELKERLSLDLGQANHRRMELTR